MRARRHPHLQHRCGECAVRTSIHIAVALAHAPTAAKKESLLEKNYCSYGYNYLYSDLKELTFNPVVEGSREENNKWRGREHDFMKDVKVKTILFDQILVSQNLKDHVVDRGVFMGASAVVGTRSRVRFQGNDLFYTTRGNFASDHVPVWAVLKF